MMPIDTSNVCKPLRSFLLAMTLAASVIVAARAADRNGDAVMPSNTSDTSLAEIVVTAQKRTATVQSTPISITALTLDDIQTSGVSSAQGISQLVPGMAIASAGPGQAIYEIRGLSADAGESPTVGFYLDETPITPPATATTGKSEIDPDLYDLERVEVLRGPQGTLYGAGSMGGTIKLIPTPPHLDSFQGSAESILSGTKGGALNYAEKGMLNIPLVTDKVALRIVGSYGHDSGYIDRIVVPNFPLPTNPIPGWYGSTRGTVAGAAGSQIFKGVNDNDTTTARVSFLIKPTASLTITPSLFYQSILQDGINAYDSSPGTFAHYQPFDIPEPFSDKFTVGSLTVNYDFEPLSVTSATGYWTRRSSQVEDGTEQMQNFFQFPAFTTAGRGLGPVYGYESNTTKQFSQEIRIASRREGHFKWLLGGFYSKFDANFSTGNTAQGLLALAPTNIIFHLDLPLTIKQDAAFANVSYTLSNVTLTLGGRYFSYTSNTGTNEQGFAFNASGETISLPSVSAKASGVLPLINLSYSPTTDLLFYASAAKGFREGAGNFPAPTACLPDLQMLGLTEQSSFNPDTVWSYELGEKGRLFDGRMTLNSDIYYTKWSKVQQPVALPCGVNFTANGPNAKIEGAELELRAKLTSFISLTQSIGYTHAVFIENFPAAAVMDGEPLLDVPEWTVSTTLQYERPVSSQLKMFVSVSNSYRSNSEEITYSQDHIPARDITDARLGIDAGRWSVALFVNNLRNQRKPIEYFNLLSFTGPPYDRIATNQPLTAGVDLNVHF